MGGYGVRRVKLYAACMVWNGGGPTRPRWRLLLAGFAPGLEAMPARVSVSQTSQPKDPDFLRASAEPTVPDQRPWRLASLDSTVVFAPPAEDRQAEPAAEDIAVDSDGRSFAERYAAYAAIDPEGRSFAERYGALFDLPVTPPAAETP